MDYVVGSVAALVSGNVTPNRPRLVRRALTPTKHQPSPNVTPKSEFIEDRSIFLSPTLQKKKAIVKKSPKRIFQNPDLETTDSNDGNLSMTSPKAEKVKKHLKDELESDSSFNKSKKSPKHKLSNSQDLISSQEDLNSTLDMNQNTPKKKKKKQNAVSNTTENVSTEDIDISKSALVPAEKNKSPKQKKKKHKSVIGPDSNIDQGISEIKPSPTKQKSTANNNNANTAESAKQTDQTSKKKNKKRKKKAKAQKTITTDSSNSQEINNENVQETIVSPKKKDKKRKKSKQAIKPETMEIDNVNASNDEENNDDEKNSINPNAITDKDSDSEHDSDDEIESENEEINKKVLDTGSDKESSDEEEDENPVKSVKPDKKADVQPQTLDEIKRTLFIGNVPFSHKTKKEIKKIFSKHGQIETVRIRAVPIKDSRYTPKMAIIKNELHPERTTVNVYVKYADAASVEQALVENNTVLNEYHLRVSRSDSTGAEHDPRCSVFVGNLPFALEDEAFRAKFEGCGDIQSVRIVRDKKTNVGKGFGYVNFASKDGVELALALTEEDLTIKNRIIRVKRCTQSGNKHKPGPSGKNHRNQKPFPGKQFNRQKPDASGPNQFQRQKPGPNQFRQKPGAVGSNQFQRQKPGGRGNNQFQQRPGNQMNQRGGFGPKRFEQGGFQKGNSAEGAFRRITNKRQHPEGGGDGPPNKKQNTFQPNKEKKTHKEFVGMTAEKKKKHKVDKGQKKKKALSEILTK